MKARVIVSAVVAASLGLGSISSFAQAWDGRGNHPGRDGQWSRDAATPRPDGDRPARHRDDGDRHGSARPLQHVAPAPAWRGAERSYDRRYVQPGYVHAAPRHDWRRGDQLPHDWRYRMSPVGNWGAYNLYAPPAGYGWVQSDTGDFLLVALATGLIANLLMNR